MGFLLLEVRGRSKDLQILILPFNISYLQNSFLHVLHIIGSCDKCRPGSIVLLYKRRKNYPEKLNNYMIRQLWNQEKNTTFAVKYFSPSTLHRNKSHPAALFIALGWSKKTATSLTLRRWENFPHCLNAPVTTVLAWNCSALVRPELFINKKKSSYHTQDTSKNPVCGRDSGAVPRPLQ